MVSFFKEIRNLHEHLICTANDSTGEVKTQGPHKSEYIFTLPIGSTFTVVRGNCKSIIRRTPTAFTVTEEILVA